MYYQRKSSHRSGMLLLACAFAFVYLLARQFQGNDIVQRLTTPKTINQHTDTTTQALIDKDTNIGQTISTNNITNITPDTDTATNTFKTLHALPQSFMTLGLSSTEGILIDEYNIIISQNTNSILRTGDTKIFTGSQLQDLGIQAQSLTFFNDPSRTNIMVVAKITNNNQSMLVQIPYAVYRNNKTHINSIIKQLTQ